MSDKLDTDVHEWLVRFGEYLRRSRHARGVSRAKLAEAMGMHVGNYARIERGEKNLTIETLLRIAAGLGVTLNVALEAARKDVAARKARSTQSRARGASKAKPRRP